MANVPAIPPTPSGLAPALQQQLSAIAQAVNTLLGVTGTGLNAATTLNMLVSAGIATVSTTGQVVSAPQTPIIDYTQPPAPTGLIATGALGNILLTWDIPVYSNHAYTEIWRNQVTFTGGIADASVIGTSVKIGTAAGYSSMYTDSIGASSDCWYWIKFVSQANVAGPFNAVSGVRGTTSSSPAMLLSVLNSQITATQLATSLATPISLITAPSSTVGSVAYQVAAEATARATALATEASIRGTAITNEATIRQTATDNLAQSISMITAGVAGGFDPGAMWYFDATVEAWTGTSGTLAWNAGWIDFTATAALPRLTSPTISVVGSQYSTIRARVKRLAGTGWSGSAHYTTSAHGMTDLYHKIIADPALAVGGIAVLEWDMTALTAGGTDWVASTITQIGFDLGLTTADVFSFDWIAVGRNAPGASMAGLSTEQTARIAADSANATSLTTLSAQVNHATTLLPATAAAITTEQTARATADTALSSSISALTSTVSVKNQTFVQTTAPTASAIGDLWIDTTNGNRINRWSGTAWVAYQDTALSTAIGTAQATANAAATSAAGKNVTFVQTNTPPPTALAIGDLWIDTSSGNVLKRWNGGSWVAYQDTAIATLSANLVTEQSARATADTAISSSVTTLSSTVSTKNQTFIQSIAPTANAIGDLWINSGSGNAMSRWNGTGWVAIPDAGIAAALAQANLGVTNAATAQTTANTAVTNSSANATAITALTSTVNTNASTTTAAINTEASTRATADTAISSSVSTLTTTVNGNTTSLATQATSINGLSAQYTVKIDTNGYVSGFGLASTLVNGVPYSDFIIAANRFAIVSPTVAHTPGTAAPAAAYPFTVVSTAYTNNGVLVPVGVYMQDTYIANGTIVNAKIGDLAVDNAKISSMSVDKLVAGSLAVGQYAQSSGYVAGSTGWRINGDGTAEFSGVTVRGNVQANSFSQITLGTNQHIKQGQTAYNTGTGFFLGDNGLGTPVFSLGVAGGAGLTWNGTALGINGSGTFSGSLSAATGTFAGALSGATGTFAGALSAATGSFAGSLSAATGTFSGSLTASAVNAVDTINLAGQAVTIPVSASSSVATSIPPSGAWVNVLSVAINSSGAPISVTAAGSATAYGGGGVGANCQGLIRVIRDNSVASAGCIMFDGAVDAASGVSAGAGGGTVVITDTPGVGVHTYTVQYMNNSFLYFTNVNVGINLMETKR